MSTASDFLFSNFHALNGTKKLNILLSLEIIIMYCIIFIIPPCPVTAVHHIFTIFISSN